MSLHFSLLACDFAMVQGSASPPRWLPVLKQSKDLIRNMTMFNDSLPGLPEKRTIIIKLKYHSPCPEDYEPSFFRAASADAYSKFAGAPKRVQLGDISTPFHAMTLTFTGANWLFEEDDDDF